MFWAINDETGETEAASRYNRKLAFSCPLCGQKVIPRTGDLVLWHFAHERYTDCDTWTEGETQWHLDWKSCVPQNMREYTIHRTFFGADGPEDWIHRADILNGRGTVIEFQHSPLSPDVVREREAFYQDMIWVVDLTAIGFPSDRFMAERYVDQIKYTWKKPYKWIRAIRPHSAPLFFDLGDGKMFRARDVWGNGKWGVGHHITKKDFKKLYMV